VVLALLRALAASARRDLSTYSTLKTNNFFLFVALLIWGALVTGVKPVSAEPFLLLLGVLMLFPISSDPLDKLPAIRLALLPIDLPRRLAVRVVSLAFSPVLRMTGLPCWAFRPTTTFSRRCCWRPRSTYPRVALSGRARLGRASEAGRGGPRRGNGRLA
jgi:hypothetical protein